MITYASDKPIRAFFLRHIRPASRVLDAGCGEGWATYIVAKSRPDCAVIGVDQSRRKVQAANRLLLRSRLRSRAVCRVESAERLGRHFGRSVFDCAVTSHSLHHFDKPRRVLREIRAVLRPEGELLLGELTPEYGGRDDCPRYPLRKIVRLVKESGFQVIAAETRRPGVILVRARKPARPHGRFTR